MHANFAKFSYESSQLSEMRFSIIIFFLFDEIKLQLQLRITAFCLPFACLHCHKKFKISTKKVTFYDFNCVNNDLRPCKITDLNEKSGSARADEVIALLNFNTDKPIQAVVYSSLNNHVTIDFEYLDKQIVSKQTNQKTIKLTRFKTSKYGILSFEPFKILNTLSKNI